MRLDLDDAGSIGSAVEEVLELSGNRLYGLFNNGAFGQPGAVEDLTTEVLRAQFESNLFGWHELTRQILPVMRRQGEGRIIQNSSILGLVAMPYRCAYNASKFALEGLSDTLRQELSGTGIHVVLIEPGPVLSRFRANALAAFRRHVDPAAGFHAGIYQTMLKRLEAEGAVAPFTLPPEANDGEAQTQAERTARAETKMVLAAIDLLNTVGIRGTTLVAIGEKSGYSRGLATHHFGSKAGLFRTVLKRLSGAWSKKLDERLAGKTGLEAVEIAIDTHLEHVLAHPEYIRVQYLLWGAAIDPSSEFKPNVAEFMQIQRESVSGWIRDGQAAGEGRLGSLADALQLQTAPGAVDEDVGGDQDQV